jgi:hypothetical protein
MPNLGNIRGKNQKLGNIIIQSLLTDFKSLSCPKQVSKKQKEKREKKTR